MVQKVEGGIVIGLVAETPTVDKKEEAAPPKKRSKKTAAEGK